MEEKTYFVHEAAEYCGMRLAAFRYAHYREGKVPADGEVSGHPYWKQSTLDAFRLRRSMRAILRNGRTLYPSVAVAKLLGMSRAAFHYWMRHSDGLVRADVTLCGRPYFTLETIGSLRALREGQQEELCKRQNAKR